MLHVEAFCLMAYESDDGSIRETIWNSRDGVTPFVVLAKDGKTELSHANWYLDKKDPHHTPELGSRVFVDMTFKALLEIKRKYVEKWWEAEVEHTMGPMRDDPRYGPLGKEGTTKRLAEAAWDEGMPHLITVTPEFLRELESKRSRYKGYERVADKRWILGKWVEIEEEERDVG